MILICPSQLFFCSLVIYNTLIFYHDLCKMGQLSNRVSQLSNTSKVLVDSTNVMTTNKRQKCQLPTFYHTHTESETKHGPR